MIYNYKNEQCIVATLNFIKGNPIKKGKIYTNGIISNEITLP